MTDKKIALVTGGSRGLGKNIALKLAAKNIDVIITYLTKEEEARQVVEEIKKMGVNAAALPLSLDNIKTFPYFFEGLTTTLATTFKTGSINYLINNAGIGFSIPMETTTETQFDQLLNVQFKGVYFFTQQAVGLLNDNGAIVNISSRLAQSVMPGYSAYASMKGAIETLTRYEAKEFAPRGIRVNAVAPGPIATDFAGGFIKDNEHLKARIVAMTALGRAGEPDDIGGVVAFLCTEDARWITAQRIEVSGGMNL